MGESIEDKVLREMVADRDRALAAKEKEIAGLREQIGSLQGELKEAWKHPLSADEKKQNEFLSDYESAGKLLTSRTGMDPRVFGLVNAVKHIFHSLDRTREERDRYASAWAVVESASNEAMSIAEGKS